MRGTTWPHTNSKVLPILLNQLRTPARRSAVPALVAGGIANHEGSTVGARRGIGLRLESKLLCDMLSDDNLPCHILSNRNGLTLRKRLSRLLLSSGNWSGNRC